MPKPVGYFPAETSTPQRTGTPSTIQNHSKSKFGDVLDSARHAAPKSTASSHPPASSKALKKPAQPHDKKSAPSDEKSNSKTGKAHGAKTARVPAKVGKTQEKEHASENAETAEKEPSESAAAAETAAEADSTHHQADGKAKDSTHLAHHDDASAPAETRPRENQRVTAVSDSSHKSSQDSGNPSKGRAKPEAGQEHLNVETTHDVNSAANAASVDQSAASAGSSANSGQNGQADVPLTSTDSQIATKTPAIPGSAKTTAIDSEAASETTAVDAENDIQSATDSSNDSPDPSAATASGALSGQASVSAQTDAASTTAVSEHPAGQPFAQILDTASTQVPTYGKSLNSPVNSTASHAPAVPREAQFFQDNHASIVTSVQSKLLPNGGIVQIHLNPEELGSLSISVQVHDGVMNATFETSNDQASKLLTHSLGQLKTALETQGVSVGRLHVQQAPKDSQPNTSGKGRDGDSGSQDQPTQQREQQRREMLRKMWKRLNGGEDPLDLVA